MHKDDQMTLKNGHLPCLQETSRPYADQVIFTIYWNELRASYQDAFVEAKSRAHWLIESYKRFGQDGLSVNYRIDGIPGCFGAESTYDPLGIPMIKENILKIF